MVRIDPRAKALLCILPAAFLWCCGVHGQDARPPLRMITEAAFPPYEFLRGHEIVGIDVEICRAVAERLGRPFVAETVEFDSVIPAVISGKADIAAAGITVTEDRQRNVDFSIPYVRTGVVIIYRKSAPIVTGEQCKGRRVGVQGGTTSEAYVLERLNQEPERYKSAAEAVAAMLSGKVDCVIADIAPARNCVKGEADLAITDFISSEEYAVAVKKGQKEFLGTINSVIADLKSSGKMDEIVARFSAEADGLRSAGAPGAWASVLNDFKLCFVKNGRWEYLWKGLVVTLQVALSAILMGLMLGFLVSMVRASHDRYGYFPVLNVFAKVYLTVIRGTPMVVQLLITYYIILKSVDSKVLVAVIAFGLNSGAYQAEIMRAGIVSIDPGQMEAARALGLGYWRSMLRIILPQAVRNVLPALGNEFIVLLKDTSIVGYIALIDLAKGGDIIRSQTYSVYTPYLTVAAMYLAMVMAFTWLLGKLERHLRNTGADPVHNES